MKVETEFVDARLIATIPVSATMNLYVRVATQRNRFGARRLILLRKSSDGDDTLGGLTVLPSVLPQLIDALRTAQTSLELDPKPVDADDVVAIRTGER